MISYRLVYYSHKSIKVYINSTDVHETRKIFADILYGTRASDPLYAVFCFCVQKKTQNVHLKMMISFIPSLNVRKYLRLI